jgi:cysteinyl-tRNA synthetase
MAFRIFNTLSRKKEEFLPLNPKEVRMYSCGLTVYDYMHIGNLRAFIVADLIARYLQYKGYRVVNVTNITDVDDKTIRNANEQGLPLKDYTEKYTKAFFEDIKEMNILPAVYYPKATEHIEDIVQLIKKLKQKGHTYEHDGSIYFRISSFKGYGKLANLKDAELKENAQGRLDSDEYEKHDARDFVLWKGYKPSDGGVFWETELGKGRPGWHIECSAMSMRLLGSSFDLHTGGEDLIFPHHTNEIAQSEGATGRPFVKYWMHNGYLQVEGEKMSKSKGNFFTLRDLLKKGYSAMAIRYELLATHYKMPLNFTFEGLKASTAALSRLNNFIFEVKTAKQGKQTQGLQPLIKHAAQKFEEAMDDDLNVSLGLAAVFDFIKEAYKLGLSQADSEALLCFLKTLDGVLGVMDFGQELSLDKEIQALIMQRDQARQAKDWGSADRIRDELAARGIELYDTPEGTKWKAK